MSGQVTAVHPDSAADITYEVQVTMTADTVSKLYHEQAGLLVFKAVRTSQGGGSPLVWVVRNDFSTMTRVTWRREFQAFTSFDRIADGHPVRPCFTADIELHQVLRVNDSGTGEVATGAAAKAISIRNTAGKEFTSGISQSVDDSIAPVCAFPLHGQSIDVITPVEKVLLVLTSERLEQGRAVSRVLNQSLLVDFTTVNQRSVAYDIDKGWSWGGAAWAHRYAPNSDLVQTLIDLDSKPPERPAPTRTFPGTGN